MNDELKTGCLTVQRSAFSAQIMSDEHKEIFFGGPARRRVPQTFRLDDTVRVLSGPFASFTGRIEGINQARRLLKVRVEIFGRETPLKLGYAEVEQVTF
jgi:transcription antitermination factor NusG